MLLGFNYPYSHNRAGAQIGPDPHVDDETWAANMRREAANDLASIKAPGLFLYVDRNLRNLKKMGFSVVRWFLLGNGENYGPRPTRVSRSFVAEGRDIPLRYTFEPPPRIDRRFKRDFTALLECFKRAEMQIIPSLISFEFGSDLKCGPSYKGQWYGGRADCIRRPAARKVFLDTMLAELLQATKGYEKQIYAWEVINEPVWLCIEYGPLSSRPYLSRVPEVSIPEMHDFLKEATTRIDNAASLMPDRRFPSTVGHRYYDDLTAFPKGSAPQFHFYAEVRWYIRFGGGKNDPPISQTLFSGSPKPFLGEFHSDNNVEHPAWSRDIPKNDTTLERLRLLERSGCELVLIWPDMPAEGDSVVVRDVIKLMANTRSAIVQFTGGQLPPANE